METIRLGQRILFADADGTMLDHHAIEFRGKTVISHPTHYSTTEAERAYMPTFKLGEAFMLGGRTVAFTHIDEEAGMPICEDVTPTFDTEQEAKAWFYEDYLAGEDCIDNDRFAYEDDDAAMSKYEDDAETGCCGSSDVRIIIAGRAASIGANYGH